MRRALVACALAVTAPAAVCAAQEPGPDELRADTERARPQLDGEALERRARDSLDLGLEVLRCLPHGNAVVSPQAIAQTLALAYAGAGGETAAELGRALQANGGVDATLAALNALDQAIASREGTGRGGTFRLRLEPSVWAQRGLSVRPEYLDALATHFGVGVRAVDVAGDLGATRTAINGWVERAVGERLDDLARTGGVSGDLRASLIAVASLDAAWQAPFEPGRTWQGNFISQGAGLLQVPLMNVTGPMTVVTTEGIRAVDVPFARDDLRLMVLVPEQGEVGELARSITADQLARIAAALRQPPRTVVLWLPRVRVETRVDLREPLKRAGVRDLFSSRADLTGIVPAGGLRVAAAVHLARVDLDERGAGGATAVALGARPAAFLPAPRQQPAASFEVNRPFLFLIRDRETGAVLFLGRVMDPR